LKRDEECVLKFFKRNLHVVNYPEINFSVLTFWMNSLMMSANSAAAIAW